MNNSIFGGANRATKREKKKIKRKILVQLLGKQKSDKRTEKNLIALYEFITARKEFTGPELVKNKKMKSSVAYDLLKTLKKKHMIKKVAEKPSPGRGKTEIYKLTNTGKLTAAFVTENTALLVETLRTLRDEQENPLMKFSLEAFIENYDDNIMKQVLEGSFKKAVSVTDKINFDLLVSDTILEASALAPLSNDSEVMKIGRKNARLMESQNNRAAFLYSKMQIESYFLRTLTGEKLGKYVEALDESCVLLHIPCENEKCNNVILLSKLTDLPEKNRKVYCVQCDKSDSNKKRKRTNVGSNGA